MDKVYIIEYDNGESYEDHISWISECYFTDVEKAMDFLYKDGFEENEYGHLEGYHNFKRFEENEWYEYTYAEIKELKTHIQKGEV